MKNFRIPLARMVLLLIVAACGSKNAVQNSIDDRPSFVKKPPMDSPEFLFETGTGSSVRMEVAEEKAMMDASAKIARKLEQRVDAMQKSFIEEITSGNAENSNYIESFSSVKKIITSATLKGLAKVESEMKPDEQSGGYRAYTLVRYPVGEAAVLLQNALSRDQELYVKFKESKAFRELEEELKNYKQDN